MDAISQKSSDASTNAHKCTIEGCKNKGPFNTENLLSRHYKTAHSSVKFGCYKCERKFTDQAILFVHLSLNHSVEIPDKKQILLFDGSIEEPIGFLEVEERLVFLDEANGLMEISDFGILPSDLAQHIQIIDSPQIETSEEISSIDLPLNDGPNHDEFIEEDLENDASEFEYEYESENESENELKDSTNQILQNVYTINQDTLDTAVHEEKMPKKGLETQETSNAGKFCSICSYVFWKKSDLDKHVARVHEGKKPETYGSSQVPKRIIVSPKKSYFENCDFPVSRNKKSKLDKSYNTIYINDMPKKVYTNQMKTLQKSCQTKVITVSLKNDHFNDLHVGKIEELPEEVMNYIFSFLNIQNMCRCAQVSRRWKLIAYKRWHKVNLADKEVPFAFIGQLLEFGTRYLSLCWSNLHTRLNWDVFPRKNHPIFEGNLLRSIDKKTVKR